MNRSSRRAQSLRVGRLASMSLAALFLAAATVSCSDAEQAEQVEQEDIGESSGNLCRAEYGSAPAVLWPGGVVPVCWSRDAYTQHPSNAGRRSSIRAAVEDSWGRAAKITFNEWDNCDQGINGVNSNANMPGTLVLALEAYSGSIASLPGFGSVGYQGGGNDWAVVNTTRSDLDGAARHVMGRILGFANEEQRPGSSTSCTFSGSQVSSCGVTPPATLSPADSSSIMRFCASSLGDLSWKDVLGAQELYGRKPHGTIAGLGGRCLDVTGNSTASGTPIKMQTCTGGANQSWYRQTNGQLLLTGAPYNGADRCLAIANSVSPNEDLLTYSCAGAPNNEVYYFEGVKWLALGNLCLQSASGALNDYISPGSCTGANSNWDFLPSGQIRQSGTNLCVTVIDVDRVPTASVQLRTCSLSVGSDLRKAQQFPAFDGRFQPRRRYDRGDSQNPLYVSPNGGNLSTTSLAPFPNHSRFRISGKIQAKAPGVVQCLDVPYGDYTSGNYTQVYNCDPVSRPYQTWEYNPDLAEAP